MKTFLAAFLIGCAFLPTHAFADSENEHLSCVKELPDPYSLATRRNYVLTCRTKAPGLTVSKITANEDQCACRPVLPTENMKQGARIMSICRDAGHPCDFTDVKFKTSAGDFIFTWSPDDDALDIP